MGKVIDMKSFNGSMTPVKLTATSKGVGLMADNKKPKLPTITKDEVDAAMNDYNFKAAAAIMSNPVLTAEEKSGICDLITSLTNCHKTMTKYSTGKEDWVMIMAQGIQSVIMSSVIAAARGPATMTKLAAVAYDVAKGNADVMDLIKQMMSGCGVEGKEVPMNDDDKE